MKVLITNTGPWGTGSFTVAKAVLNELIELGHEVKIFFPDSKYPSKDVEEYYSRPDIFKIWKFPLTMGAVSLESFPLIIPDPHPRNHVGKTFLQLDKEENDLYFQDFEKQIKELIDDFKPDIIECQHIWAFDHIIKKLGHPYICVAHYSDQLGFKYDSRMQPIALESARHAEYIFSISEFVTKEVVSIYGVNPEKVITLANGYDKKTFKPFLANRKKILENLNLNIPDDALLVTFAGKISKTKGVDILLMANKLLKKKTNVHFLLLGSGDINKVLTEETKPFCSFDNVHFLGHQPSEVLAELHNISYLSVLPSRSEGFGIACLEAMGCGLPMVVTKTGALEEYAVGRCINSESPQELADAILEIIQLPTEEYKDLSNRALEVAKKFSWTEITKERIKYYEKVIRKKNLNNL